MTDLNLQNTEIGEPRITPITEKPGVSIINIDPSLVVAGVSLTLSFAGAWFWKYILQPKLVAMKHSFRRTLENDIKIQGRLYIILEKVRANRILLYQAHNGSTYSSGQHPWKVSITHEALASGVSSVKHWSQAQPAVEFLKNYMDLLKDKASFLSMSDESMIDLKPLRHKFLNHGTGSILTVVVPGYQTDEIIGFLSIHWPENYEPTEIQKSTVELQVEIDKISGLLLREDSNPFLIGIEKLWKRH